MAVPVPVQVLDRTCKVCGRPARLFAVECHCCGAVLPRIRIPALILWGGALAVTVRFVLG